MHLITLCSIPLLCIHAIVYHSCFHGNCNYVCNGDWETQECTPFCGVADTLDIETVCSQSSADVSDCGIGGDSCTSAEESKYCNCSCDQVDCNGVCGGTAVRDECGYCSTNVSDYTNLYLDLNTFFLL